MKYFKFLFPILVLSQTPLFAQKTGLINSGEEIKKAAALYDSSKYNDGLVILNKINRSDTNYVWSLYEKAIDLQADSQYNESIKVCLEALSRTQQREYEPEIYNAYGNNLDYLGKHDDAIRVYDAGIAKYPAYSELYFNKAVALMGEEKYPDAEQWFKKTLLINPYMYSAHYQLARVALQQGKIIPAFLSYTAYLLVDPEGRYKANAIKALSEIGAGDDEIIAIKNKRTVNPDENYQETEDIVFSKIALDKAYKLMVSVDDPISRQMQAVFEKLEYKENSDDFWIQYYLPYFKQVYNEHKFEPFVFHCFSGVNLEVVQNYTKKNKRELQTFVNEAADYFNLIRSTRELNYKKRDAVTERYLFDNGALVGKGTLTANGKDLTGKWTSYYSDGNLKTTGIFDAEGKREGEWQFYSFNGHLNARERYNGGKLEGVQEYYFDNGNQSSKANYSDDKHDGQTTTWYYGGNIKSTTNYKLGKKEGEQKDYYSNGNLNDVANYTANQLNGTYREYYKSGQLKTVEEFAGDKAEGPYKSYYESGGLDIEGQYVKGNGEGEWKYYYENGKLKQKRNYAGDKLNGICEEYFDNGQLSSHYTAKEDKTSGEITYYYKDGKPEEKFVYDNGIIQSGSFFNNAGNSINIVNISGGITDVTAYSYKGYRREHSFEDAKGNVTGPDTTFYPSGKVSGIYQYKNDKYNGPSVTFYLNGKKKIEVNKTDGDDDGYYIGYYRNGKIQAEGWEVSGKYQGEWRYYDELGRLTAKSYYLDGDLDGYKEEYNPGGKKIGEEEYYRGWLVKLTQYDSLQNVIGVDTFPKESGKYVLYYPNKQVMAQGYYQNGDLNGSYNTYYFDGSVESKAFYNKGMIDSSYVSFYYGGIKYTEGNYKKGNKSGAWKTYEEDGKLSSTSEYAGDELNGQTIYYFPSGTKDFVSTYKDDEFDGVSQKYDPDGTLAYESVFEDGEIKTYAYLGKDGKMVAPIPVSFTNGVMKAYFPSGKPSRACYYSDGKQNGPDIMYYNNGQIRSTDTTSYGDEAGIWREYHNTGKLSSQGFYVAGTVTGTFKEYDENGALKKESVYENGENHGPVKYYDKNGRVIKTMSYYYGKLLAVKNE